MSVIHTIICTCTEMNNTNNITLKINASLSMIMFFLKEKIEDLILGERVFHTDIVLGKKELRNELELAYGCKYTFELLLRVY